jgi:hypothetical protein
MPLQNRVSPFGELFADPARGTVMGNRGGRFHRGDRTLSRRRWTSRQWICCVLDFKDRHRDVWSAGYTELFFLDEVTALAAGHRPCFECRRVDARSFADEWRRAFDLPRAPTAPEMDRVLHGERLDGRQKCLHKVAPEDLPDGASVLLPGEDETAWMVKGDTLLRWTPSGYSEARPRPRDGALTALTPPAILAVLGAGYVPRWHDSAARLG